MALVQFPLAGVTELSVTHSPGQLAPAVSTRMFPDAAALPDASTWLDYTPPETEITVNGVSWLCTPREIQVTLDQEQGVLLDAQFYPTLMEVLQNVGYAKNVVFLSCPEWQYNLIADEYDSTEYELYYQACDAWISNGWTVNAIIAKLVQIYTEHRIDEQPPLTLTSLLPDLHVQNATTIFERGQSYLSFIMSLLPSDFTYAWNLIGNKLQLTLAEPATTTFTLPAGILSAQMTQTTVPNFTLIEATAGMYKEVNGVSLGTVSRGGWVTSDSGNYTDVTETDTITPTAQSNPIQQYATGTIVTRTKRQGPTGEFFCLLKEEAEENGQIYSNKNVAFGNGRIGSQTRAYTYENTDPSLYQTPRLLTQTTTRSGYTYIYKKGYQNVSVGMAYFLTEDYQVITPTEYDAADADKKPTIICSAVREWKDAYETATDTKTYTTNTAASKDWPEGTERSNTINTDRLCSLILAGTTTLYADSAEAPSAILQTLGSKLSAAGLTSINGVTTTTKSIESTQRELRLVSPRTYSYVETRRTFDSVEGRTREQTNSTQVDSRSLPSCPTQYRVKQLKTTITAETSDRGWTGDNIIPLKIHIPTNNPADAQVWWAKAYWQKTQPQRTLTLTSFDVFAPVGSRVAGGTVIGYTITLDGQQQQTVTLNIL